MPSILVDPRAGSKHLIPHLRAIGVKVEEEQTGFGDVSFVGNGPNGPEAVGLEHKKINDVLDCIHGGRYAGHQLPGLLDCYPTFLLLIVQGNWASTDDGRLLVNNKPKVWRGKNGYERHWLYREVVHWLWTMQFQGGIPWLPTRNYRQSAQLIKTLFTWFTAKLWHEHKSLNVVYSPRARQLAGGRATFARKFASTLPGVDWVRSAAIARRFRSPEKIMQAAKDGELVTVPGIGKVTARKALWAITKEGV